MHKTLILTFIFLFYSCGSDNSTNSPIGLNYHSNDNAFITELVNTNAIELDKLNNRITTINTEDFDRIKTMDLSNLGLTSLPAIIDDLDYLEELNLSNNLFSNFPEELCNVYSKISVIPIENNILCDPTVITHCVLENITVDFEKQACTQVKYDQEMDFLLQFIRNNNLDSVSANIFNEIKWSWVDTDSALTDDGKHIERIVEIKWVNYGITNLPGTISHLNFLKKLELEENQLSTLPNQMKYLENLTELQLHDNILISLPEFIGEARNLKFLDLHNNLIDVLPESIGLLEKLEFLDVGENKLTSLSDTLCVLYSNGLQLNIECNDLDESHVPDCLIDRIGSQNDHPNCSGG